MSDLIHYGDCRVLRHNNNPLTGGVFYLQSAESADAENAET